jgi:hypothetical protein
MISSRKFSSVINILSPYIHVLGSRWTNIHMGAKTKAEYIPPPPPKGFDGLADHAELVRTAKMKYQIEVTIGDIWTLQ